MPSVTIDAQPAPITADAARLALVIIDMQRDFLEQGGFGEALGNDVSRLRKIVPACASLLAGLCAAHIPIIPLSR
jgi:biuret amidohydrolase